MLFKITLCLLFSASVFALPGFHEPWGRDADIDFQDPEIQVEEKQTYSVLVRAFEKVQLFHQNIISPVDGPRSHFRPTSSKYMLLAMQRHGFIKGFVMGCDRLLRENDDDWVYRTKFINGKLYKWDPPPK